ncbi:MAG: hypothetical protein ACREUE_10210 [Panacagrimonas sp.]
MMPLFAAAVVAYEEVFSTRRRDEHVSPSVDELDLVALALAAQLPIYGVRGAGREASCLTEEELLDGMFWGGAMRFEMGDGLSSVTRLAVRKEDLERVLAQLKR